MLASPLTEALELSHRALHLLASGVGGRADALDAELELVGVGSADERLLVGDQLAGEEVAKRLVKGLHAVLAGAGGAGVVDQARLIGIDYAVADIGSSDHYLDGGNAALVVGAAHQALADDGLERAGHLQANLFLLGRREDGDDALD